MPFDHESTRVVNLKLGLGEAASTSCVNRIGAKSDISHWIVSISLTRLSVFS
jgi:hypothetical protein